MKRERLNIPRKIRREFLDPRDEPRWRDAYARADHAMDVNHRREASDIRQKLRKYEDKVEWLRDRLEWLEQEIRKEEFREQARLRHGHSVKPKAVTPQQLRRQKAERNGWIVPTKGPMKPADPEFTRWMRDLSRRPHALAVPGRGRPPKPAEDA